MEPLQRLTRRQLDVLERVRRVAGGPHGVALNALARSLGVAPPSALEHLRALESLGLVRRKSGKTWLTPRGDACLVEYRRHHRVAESLFGGAGLDARSACSAAREIDLALTHRTVDRLWVAQGRPSRCPHGEPIVPTKAGPKGG